MAESLLVAMFTIANECLHGDERLIRWLSHHLHVGMRIRFDLDARVASKAGLKFNLCSSFAE